MSERTLSAASQTLRRRTSSLATRHAKLRQAAGQAAILTTMALIATPASAQFICTTTPTDRTCTNSSNAQGNAGAATANNSGSNAANGPKGMGIAALTQNGGNATAINSGSNAANGPGGIGIFAATLNGGDATVINSGTTTGGVSISATGGNAIMTDIVGARIVGAIGMTGTSQMVNFAAAIGCSPSIHPAADPQSSMPAARRL